jgi:hypothetical protein
VRMPRQRVAAELLQRDDLHVEFPGPGAACRGLAPGSRRPAGFSMLPESRPRRRSRTWGQASRPGPVHRRSLPGPARTGGP